MKTNLTKTTSLDDMRKFIIVEFTVNHDHGKSEP